MSSVTLSAGTIETIAGAAVAWADPTFALVSDNTRATAALSAGSPLSNPLRFTAFDFSAIPTYSAILGLEVDIEAKTSSLTSASLDTVQIVDGGAAVGTLDGTDAVLTASDAVYTYGGASAEWGLTLTESLLDADFGFELTAKQVSGSPSVGVDYASLTVHYGIAAQPRARIVGITGALERDGTIGVNYSTINGVIVVEVCAFHEDGIALVGASLDDGVNPPVTGSATEVGPSAHDGFALVYRITLDPSALNDGALTLTVTATADDVYSSTREQVWQVINNAGGTISSWSEAWVEPYADVGVSGGSGTFTEGEKLTFSGGAVGWFIAEAAGTLTYGIGSTTNPLSAETVTGATSGATRTLGENAVGRWSGSPAVGDPNNPYRTVKAANAGLGVKNNGCTIYIKGVTGKTAYYAEPERTWFALTTTDSQIGWRIVTLADGLTRGDVIHRQSADSYVDFVVTYQRLVAFRALTFRPSAATTGSARELIKFDDASAKDAYGAWFEDFEFDASESAAEWIMRGDKFPDSEGQAIFAIDVVGTDLFGGWNRWALVRNATAMGIQQDALGSGNLCEIAYTTGNIFGVGTHSDYRVFDSGAYPTAAAGNGDINYISVNCAGTRSRCQYIFRGEGGGAWVTTPNHLAIINDVFSDTTSALGWLVGTAYVEGESFFYGGTRYACQLAHTSTADDEPGVGVNWATYWASESFGGSIWEGAHALMIWNSTIDANLAFLGTDRAAFTQVSVKGSYIRQLSENVSAAGAWDGTVDFDYNHYYRSAATNVINLGTNYTTGVVGDTTKTDYADMNTDWALIFASYSTGDLSPVAGSPLIGALGSNIFVPYDADDVLRTASNNAIGGRISLSVSDAGQQVHCTNTFSIRRRPQRGR